MVRRDWNLVFLRVRIDSVGRVVIPKPLPDLLGIAADSELEVSRDGAGLRLDPVAGQGRQVVDVDGVPLLRSVRVRCSPIPM